MHTCWSSILLASRFVLCLCDQPDGQHHHSSESENFRTRIIPFSNETSEEDPSAQGNSSSILDFGRSLQEDNRYFNSTNGLPGVPDSIECWNESSLPSKRLTDYSENGQSQNENHNLGQHRWKRAFFFGTNDYKEYSKKGKQLMTWMANPSAAGRKGVSGWSDFNDLKTYGWEVYREADNLNHLRDLLRGSQFSQMDLSSGTSISWIHERSYEVDGIEYPATDGKYTNIFYPNEGIIVASKNEGPDHQMDEKAQSGSSWRKTSVSKPVLPLKHWSDVVFLTWKQLTSSQRQPPELKWVFRRIITNRVTTKLVSDVMSKNNINGPDWKVQRGVLGSKTTENVVGKMAPTWPGLLFRPGDGGFYALIGSPNISGVCWLLIQHQSYIGHKTIGGIRVFSEALDEGTNAPTIILEIVDAPNVVYEGT